MGNVQNSVRSATSNFCTHSTSPNNSSQLTKWWTCGATCLSAKTSKLASMHYDIFSKEQLNLPFSGMCICSYSNDNRYWCFRGDVGSIGQYVYVYDLQKRQICLSIQSNCSACSFWRMAALLWCIQPMEFAPLSTTCKLASRLGTLRINGTQRHLR